LSALLNDVMMFYLTMYLYLVTSLGSRNTVIFIVCVWCMNVYIFANIFLYSLMLNA